MASSLQDLMFAQDEDDDEEDKLPLSQILTIEKKDNLNEEEEEEESGDERFKKMKRRPLIHVKDYLKHCKMLKNRIINVGDLVWVNRRLPGLVEKRDHRRATVSILGSEKKPCKFSLSQLYSFEEHFKSIQKPISEKRSYAIDCALEEFGRRFVLGFMCSCQVSSMEKANVEAFMKNEFQPTLVLRFVLTRAVCACVGHGQKLDGAKKGAQVHAFRRFVYAQIDDEKYSQELRLLESNSSAADDEPEPASTDHIAGEGMSLERASDDSCKEKGTFRPPASEFQKVHTSSSATMPSSLPLSVDGHLSGNMQLAVTDSGHLSGNIAQWKPSVIGSGHLSGNIAQLQPSVTGSRSEHPTSLNMKFPQDFKLPSKDAKSEHTLFGATEFWLQPHEDSRRGTTTTAPPLSFPTGGSSDTHGKADKKERNKGKCLPESQGTCTPYGLCQALGPPPLSFPAVGSSGLKLKSCLRKPDQHGKKDRIERNKGKCLPDAHGKGDNIEHDILIPFLELLHRCQEIVNALLRIEDKKET